VTFLYKKFEWDANAFDDFINDWNQVLKSNGINLCQLIWDAFIRKWNCSHVAAVKYLKRIWLIHKEKICWTNQYLHFGTTSTLRGEGNHFFVERYLKIANGDMLTVLNNSARLFQAQFTDLNSRRRTIQHWRLSSARAFNAKLHQACNISLFSIDGFGRKVRSVSLDEC
jgi:hypothetical protein